MEQQFMTIAADLLFFVHFFVNPFLKLFFEFIFQPQFSVS